MSKRRGKSAFVLLIIPALLLFLALFLRAAGELLVLDDRPGKAGAIVVLAGDVNDRRYERGLQLLQNGYAPILYVDANSDLKIFGRTVASQEEEFIKRQAGALADRVNVCPMQGDSTYGETNGVQHCLHDRDVKDVILVTSDFHSRRAMSIFRRRLPRYHWSIAVARDEMLFGERWWQHRVWAKMTLLEWSKLVWWEAVENWRSPER